MTRAGAVIAVSDAGVLGGAERLLLDVATGLSNPPLLACPPGPLADAARERGLGVFELRDHSLELRRSPAERVAATARMAARAVEVRSLVAAQRPETVLAWSMRAQLAVCAAFPRRRPRLVFQHNDLLPGPLIGRAVRACARRADLVVAPSRCVARDLDPQGALGERLAVVPPGVDLERFRPHYDGHQDDVLLLGAIEPWKRPDLALEAVARAARELPGVRLLVGGAPIGDAGRRLLEQLRRRAADPDLDGRVELLGPLSRPEDALARAACLLHCAEREPYGIVVAEALASGIPVVAPDSCGPRELVTPETGRLYAPGDPEAAARALVEVLRDRGERARLGAAARARAERDLGIERTLAAYEELLGGVGGARSRPGSPSTSRGADLAVITVLHDSEAEVERLLASLEEHLPAAQVVVVDSGSSDGGAELARGWRGGHAQVVELGANVGFGRGVNAGLELVTRPVTALLNPDCELLDASLATAADEASRHPDRLLAPVVLRPDGSREDNAQHEPGSAPLVLHALIPGALLPTPLAALTEPWRASTPRRVGWAVGSCVVAATDTLRALGGFDDRAFMYAEDLDLCLRATDAGVETWFWPAARVRHGGAHASRRVFDGEPVNLLARRRREVVRERRGERRVRRDDLLQRITFADRLALKRLAGRPATRERRQLEALRSARRRGAPDGGGAP